MVSVGILPMPDKNLPLIKDDDLEIKTQGGHGKGGQHQNVTDSAVRMKHKPTGISVFINGRDQHANRREALRILTAKVDDHFKQKKDKAYAALRRKQMGDGGRGDKVRTYNFIKSRVVDHRLNNKTKQIKQVMKGQFWLVLGDDFKPGDKDENPQKV
jgi:peptide chain release factor 1